MPNKKINKCPHCGSIEGFYKKCYITGVTEYHYPFNQNILDKHGNTRNLLGFDNSHIHENLKYRENKTAYCIECNKSIKELTI